MVKRRNNSSDPSDPRRDEILQLLQRLDKPKKVDFEGAVEHLAKIVSVVGAGRMDAHDQILSVIYSAFISTVSLPGYATLHWDLIRGIADFRLQIKNYIEDSAQKRPLNFLMLASPGEGKSHFIDCIAGESKESSVRAITYNMAALQTYEDLVPPLDAARNLKVEDTVPLLFLDEIDTHLERAAPVLLPLMWDGRVAVRGRDLKLGKIVIVLAASDPKLRETMAEAKNLTLKTKSDKKSDERSDEAPKILDLLSRINGGVIDIPPLKDRRADKVCIAAQLLMRRIGKDLRSVSLPLMRFIATTDFRYGARSITNLVNSISIAPGKRVTELRTDMLGLPLDSEERLRNSSLVYHLNIDNGLGTVIDLWNKCCKKDGRIFIANETLESYFDHHLHKADKLALERFFNQALSEMT